MKLIVGLGNPGNQYKSTRHNIWATMLEKFLEWEQLGQLKYDAKFASEILIAPLQKGGRTLNEVKGTGGSEQTIFATPQTFMNLSGNAVESIARYYQIKPENILVLHDEIELPLGKIALKNWWGAAGHNGLRSITTKLGTPDFMRLRIGVGKSEKIGVAEYVLQKIKPNEQEILQNEEEEIFEKIRTFLQNE